MLAAAWSTQIAGHATGENFGLDLTNFPHQQGNLKFEIEFYQRRGKSGVKNMRVVSKVSLGLMIVIGLGAPLAIAEDFARVSVTLKDHKFSPAEPSAPAGKPIVIDVSNLDSTPSEFESKTLRVEKVVPAGGKISIQVRPLSAGRYRFFDDYHEDTTEGFLVVK